MTDITKYDLDYRPARNWHAKGNVPSTTDIDDEDEGGRPAGEADILGIQLNSTLGDWIALRAWQEEGLIRYRIVTEQEQDGSVPEEEVPLNIPGITESSEPLTFGELIDSLERTTFTEFYANRDYGHLGLVESYFDTGDSAYRNERERNRGFVTVWSNFYPQASEYYDEVKQEWIDAAPERPREPS